MSNFRVGSVVNWTSQSQGITSTKTGTIVGVVPAFQTLEESRLRRLAAKGISVAKVRDQLTRSFGYRDEKSYLVNVDGKLYWPNTFVLLNSMAAA